MSTKEVFSDLGLGYDKDKRYQLVSADSVGEYCGAILNWWEKNQQREDLRYDGEKNEFQNQNRVNPWKFGKNGTLRNNTEKLLTGASNNTINKIYQDIYSQIMGLKEITELQRSADSIKRKRVFKEDGSELSIDRVMSGDPAHWETTTRNKKRPLVKIGYNLSASAGGNEDFYAKIAAYGTVAADLIVRAGYSCEVYALNVTSYGHLFSRYNDYFQVAFKIKLKAAEEQVDIQRMLSVGMTGLERFYNFTMCSKMLEHTKGSYGNAHKIDGKMLEMIGVDNTIDAYFGGHNLIINLKNILSRL